MVGSVMLRACHRCLAPAKAIGKDEADNSDMEEDDIPF
jgi:hypothetical protein